MVSVAAGLAWRRSATALALVAALAATAGTAAAGGLTPSAGGLTSSAGSRPAGSLSPAVPGWGVPGGAPADAHVVRPRVPARVAAALGPIGELRGMSINDVGASNRVFEATIDSFPRLAAAGVNSVSLYVYLYLTDPWGSVVSSGPLTPTDQEVNLVAQAAHAAGLGLQIMPVLEDTALGWWRGRYYPSNMAQFFASYTTRVLHYADLAQQDGATLFYVGSENDEIQSQTSYWLRLVAAVRAHFSGAISYMATGSDAPSVRFWRALDLASISVYYSLGTEATPSYRRDLSAWAAVHTPYVRWLASRLPVPLIYAEAGYNSAEHSFAHPDQPPPAMALPAPAAQADAYRALLDVLAHNPRVYGVTWWRWQPVTLPGDTGYSPAGKPAECVIAAHWSENATVRAVASQPVCDLHALDAALLGVANTLGAL